MSAHVPHPTGPDGGRLPLQEEAARLWYLDTLRVGLTVLVVLHHVAMAYGAGGLEFYFVDLPEGFYSRNLLVFVLGNQAWFMGAFFLIAGYFTPGSLDGKGAGGFLSSRLVRLGTPLVLYSLLLNPLAMTGWLHMPPEIGRLTWDTFDYPARVRMGPTWFLALLLVFSFGYAGWRAIAGRRPTHRTPSPAPGLPVILAFAAALAGAGYLLRMQVAVGESWAGFPSLAYLIQYAAFFGVGILASRRGWPATLRTSVGLAGLAAAVAATVLLFPLAFSGRMFSLELTENLSRALGDGYWQSAVYALWDAILSVGLCLGLVVTLRATVLRQGAFGGLLARHSYAVYLVHIPVVVYAAVLVSKLDLGHTTKLLMAAAVAVPASFGIAWSVRKLPGASRVV